MARSVEKQNLLYETDDELPSTPQAEIDMCLECGKPRCTNCLRNSTYNPENIKPVDANVFVESYNNGDTLALMGTKLGISPDAVKTRVHMLGLSSHNRKNRPRITTQIIRDQPFIIQKYFNLKGATTP